jgi:A/G-specific adenine glycosylase
MATFSRDVIAWQVSHGRHALPWQRRDAYAIWVSEIMLQQTQVATVIPFYERFMQRFPDIRALARAALDDVLAHWSGLGYYSRARNLHRAACIVSERYGGRFPSALPEVMALPGIGRSTASAIAVFGFGERHAILDGNVKRVLARVCAIEGFPGSKRVADLLWEAAERLLPDGDIEAYTQGLMDLGSTVCTRSNPRCGGCPVSRHCLAFEQRRVAELPQPRPRKVLPHKRCGMMIIEHEGALLLEKRPAPGLWGGLWCFPQIDPAEDVSAFCMNRYGVHVERPEVLPTIDHGFTHFRLSISPMRARALRVTPRAGEADHRWIEMGNVGNVAVPSPVRRILELLTLS